MTSNHLTMGDEKPLPGGKADFEGRVVTIYFGDRARGRGHILTDVRLVKMGERVMIVGNGADRKEDDDWRVGIEFGVPWDSVTSYYSMTKKQYDRKLEEHGGKVAF